MDELKFAIKSLVVTLLLVTFMQIKWNDESFENHLNKAFKTSPVALYVQSAAVGGAAALRNLFFSSQKFVQKTLQNNNTNVEASR